MALTENDETPNTGITANERQRIADEAAVTAVAAVTAAGQTLASLTAPVYSDISNPFKKAWDISNDKA